MSQAERDYLEGVLEAEAHAKEGTNKIRVWQALRLRNVWLLALSIFAANNGGYALAFWVPSMVKTPLRRHRSRDLALQRIVLRLRIGWRLHFGAVRRPNGRPEMALCGRQAATAVSSRRQCDHWAAVRGGDDVALPHGIRRVFLAVALLGAAHAHADRLGGGCFHWLHQYVRQPGRLARQLPDGLAPIERLQRTRMSGFSGELLFGRGCLYQPRENPANQSQSNVRAHVILPYSISTVKSPSSRVLLKASVVPWLLHWQRPEPI